MKALVIGGTGPTGHYIVNGLIERGFTVTILHTGRHEVEEIPEAVEHIHTDPFDVDALKAALGTRTWDLTIATYGRLRRVAEVMVGRTGRFLSVGGGPAYQGYMNATALWPPGLVVPTAEDAPKTQSEAQDGKGYRVHLTEQAVFSLHADATHFRYPYIYGKYQIAPREWPIVKRILDRRPFILLPEDGLTLNHHGGAANMAHAVLLAVDHEQRSRGQIYNCGDIKILTLRQVVEVISEAFAYDWEIVSMPYELALSARPLMGQPWATHRVFDLTKIRTELGYTDVVDPIEGVAEAARWYASHPVTGRGAAGLQDPYDYAAEDRLRTAWQQALERLPTGLFAREPGFTASYSGPGGSQRKADW